MASVGVYEAKAHFSELLERVAKGEVITITKHNVPVAKLSNTESKSKDDSISQIVDRMLDDRRVYVTDEEIREMRDKGRR